MLAAMGKTGAAAIASGLLGALGTKMIALLLGPAAVALLQTLEQVRDGAVTVATCNGRTALVQGASALEGTARREYLRTVLWLFGAGTILVGLALLVMRGHIGRSSLLAGASRAQLPWLAATVVMLSIFGFLTAILNALGDIGKLAILQLVSPAVAALVIWPLAWRVRTGHPVALVFILAIPAAAAMGAATLALRSDRHRWRDWIRGPGRWWSAGAAHSFLSLSGAMVASGLAATTVLLAVRGSITQHQGLAMTGQFDAAWNISMNEVTLILGSVQTYYLPSLASAKNTSARSRQIRGMFLVATLATAPVIVVLTALKPWVVGVFYSGAFSVTPELLRWTLVGDYLKVSSWVLATPMLALHEVRAFLGLDLLAQAVFFGAALSFVGTIGSAKSAVIGFVVSYGVYFGLCYAYARARHGFRFGVTGLCCWLAGLACIMGANGASDATVHLAKAFFWILMALGSSAGFGLYLRRQER
jgi:PST family polysaccharide transporter